MSTWRYNRMYAAQAKTPAQKVEDATIPSRIDALLAGGLVNAWEINFLNSIKAGYAKYNSLTAGQNNTFVNIEKRYGAEAVAARDAWKAAWTAEKAENFKSVMLYYARTPYYKGVVEKYNKDNNYIPSEKEYKDTCENKYASRYLKTIKIPPKFHVGQLVVYKEYGGYKLATVVESCDVSGWAKGSREYKINVFGTPDVRVAYEKEMLYYRPSLNDKIQRPDDDAPF